MKLKILTRRAQPQAEVSLEPVVSGGGKAMTEDEWLGMFGAEGEETPLPLDEAGAEAAERREDALADWMAEDYGKGAWA